jgi:hypothetical protein
MLTQPDFQCACRGKGCAGEKQFQGALAPGQTRQALRPAERRRHGKLDLRLREQSLVACDAQMDGLGDLAPGAESKPVDGGDSRFRKRLQARRHHLPAPDEVTHRGVRSPAHALAEFMDVGAGREGAFSRPGENDGAHIGRDLDPVEMRHQQIDRLVVQGVELVRPIERQQRDFVFDGEEHGIGHGLLSEMSAITVEDWLRITFEAEGIGNASVLARQLMLLLDGSFALVLLHRDPSYMETAGEAARALVNAALDGR